MSNDDATAQTLPLLFSNRCHHPTDPNQTAYNHPHDLLATLDPTSGDIIVYRLNGQVAFTIKSRRDEEVEAEALEWKPDGSLLAVGWSDGSCGVFSGENGKAVGRVPGSAGGEEEGWKLDLVPAFGGEEDEAGEGRGVGVVGWGCYRSEERNGDGAEVEVLDEGFEEGDRKGGVQELVNAITTLDATKVLPQLSAIPSHGARTGPDGSKFTTQAGVDSVFENRALSTQSIDSLIVCSKSGHTNVLLDESVNIGNFDIDMKPLLHTSHPECSSQAMLSDASEDGMFSIHYIDLPLESLGSPLLHVIATNTKRLQNLTSYVAQTIRCIQHGFSTGLQFPTRLMNNINEELSEKEEGSLVTNLYQLAMTGSFTPTMLEWLTDIVKEPNHKRWDTSVSTMYTGIRDYAFVNLLPALDRLSIAASTLRGHARLHEGTSKFDVDPGLFTNILDQVDALRLVAQKVLLIVMTEYKQFRAFSKWLKVMIEVGIAGPGTKGAVETEEREVPNLDYSLLLAYIHTTLSSSRLFLHLEQRKDMKGTCTKSEFFSHPIITQMNRDHTIAALETLNTLSQTSELSLKSIPNPDALLNLPTLTTSLAGQIRRTVSAITTWQSKMLPSPTTTQLTGPKTLDPSARILDMKMFPRFNQAETITCILASSTGANLLLYREVRLQESKKSDFSEISLGEAQAGKVVGAVLGSEKVCTLLFDHEEGGQSLFSCDFGEYEQGHEGWMRRLHVFPREGGFTAEKVLIGGRKGKRVCIVFGKHGREWRVFDLEEQTQTVAGATRDVVEEMQF